ncbi:DUF2252 family protein [Mucilaginibacter ginkgonis]|uniref:DUF2252 family protein n=1 Tax=Mucilaginibacter ginkgonis TaxID=2682091 RepID=A0A6I4IMR2_9SPHI|nr:DUF2252 family protein [Mucilaginibacter ginkgonis]
MVLSHKNEKHSGVERQLKTKLIPRIQDWINNCDDSPFNYKVKDVVFRFAETGSLGLKRYLFLLKSPNKKNSIYLSI